MAMTGTRFTAASDLRVFAAREGLFPHPLEGADAE